jgi:AraC-like DNA-binding protein
MLDPSLTLSEISAALGYSDQAHLTPAFQRWTGEAPSAYRVRRLDLARELRSGSFDA